MGKSTYTMGRGLSKRECVYDTNVCTKAGQIFAILVRLC